MMTKTHYMVELSYSPWPLILSINIFIMMFSLLMFFKFGLMIMFAWSLFNVSFGSFFWWLSFGEEMNIGGKGSFNLEFGLKFSMLLFISSEIFFFFSFFWSYFHFFLSPLMELGLSWPPYGVLMFNWFNVPLINTLILLSSGVTVTISHFFLIEGKNLLFSKFLIFTILLGFIFSVLQKMEYQSSFFSISDSTFGTSFFMLTGFHGIHVLIGTMFLMVMLIRSINLSSCKMSFVGFELSSWYWHFVDVVWIFLYFFIYFLNN